MSVYLNFLSIYLLYLSIYYIYLSIYLSIYISIYYIYLSIYLSIYLFIDLLYIYLPGSSRPLWAGGGGRACCSCPCPLTTRTWSVQRCRPSNRYKYLEELKEGVKKHQIVAGMSVTFWPPPLRTDFGGRPFLVTKHVRNYYFYVFPDMPFPFVHSHSVDLCTKNRVLFFEENWNLKIKTVVCPDQRFLTF